jgi:hypothetical protein
VAVGSQKFERSTVVLFKKSGGLANKILAARWALFLLLFKTISVPGLMRSMGENDDN